MTQGLCEGLYHFRYSLISSGSLSMGDESSSISTGFGTISIFRYLPHLKPVYSFTIALIFAPSSVASKPDKGK